ncbi:CPBP family intramembrane glutamic endopeptidase [Devriesea agamarum]|uniref:CPBP family intramembrane glutamic endopeptidase n=1 Tax=Devriesea agamarum TaxID=472569 RepID=UPI0012EDD106|nr:CPBP family intramembrane glutamic endopeptidase [Devriesea agamarum]
MDCTRSSAQTAFTAAKVRTEIILVMLLTLGQSAVYAVVSLIAKLSQGPLSGQTTAMNTSASPRPYLDLTYQLLDIFFNLVPVALVLFLLNLAGYRAWQTLGLTLSRPWKDVGWGVALSAAIGVPGLGLYALGRALGITSEVVPVALHALWWTIPVLILQAVKNAVLEEVIVAGYLVTRLEALGWKPRWIITTSALLRGSYHLYQGFGPGIANALMGIVFAEYFRRTRRTLPLILAHTLLDTVAFVGYFLLRSIITT